MISPAHHLPTVLAPGGEKYCNSCSSPSLRQLQLSRYAGPVLHQLFALLCSRSSASLMVLFLRRRRLAPPVASSSVSLSRRSSLREECLTQRKARRRLVECRCTQRGAAAYARGYPLTLEAHSQCRRKTWKRGFQCPSSAIAAAPYRTPVRPSVLKRRWIPGAVNTEAPEQKQCS